MFVLLHYILCTSKNKALIVRKVLVCHRSMTQIYRKLWFRFRISSHWLIQVDLISPCVTRRGFLVFCCLFSHMESHSGRNCSAALGPVPANHPLDAFFLRRSSTAPHVLLCWPWGVEQYEARVRASRKGIYLIYALVRDESDRAAVFS